MSAKKILITGAQGFLGQAMSAYLRERFPSTELVLADISAFQESVVGCDLREFSAVEAFLNEHRPDWIFHLAGGRSTEETALADNEQMTENLLKAAYRLSEYDPKIVVPGSAAEYGVVGKEDLPVHEDFSCSPQSAYGKSKYRQTKTALFYAKHGMPIVVGRIFNIIGRGTPDSLVGGAFCRQMAELETGARDKLTVKGLYARRDFIDVRDVCSALVALAEHGKGGEIYNISTGEFKSLRELLNVLILFSRKDSVDYVEERGSVSESFDVSGCRQKIFELSGWKPEVFFEDSVKQMLESYRE